MTNDSHLHQLEALREKARGHAHTAKRDKPNNRYGLRDWPVLLNPKEDKLTPGVMLGGFNPQLQRWEPMYHFYDDKIAKLERVLEIGGKVPNQDKWREIDLDGNLSEPAP